MTIVAPTLKYSAAKSLIKPAPFPRVHPIVSCLSTPNFPTRPPGSQKFPVRPPKSFTLQHLIQARAECAGMAIISEITMAGSSQPATHHALSHISLASTQKFPTCPPKPFTATYLGGQKVSHASTQKFHRTVPWRTNLSRSSTQKFHGLTSMGWLTVAGRLATSYSVASHPCRMASCSDGGLAAWQDNKFQRYGATLYNTASRHTAVER